MEGNTDDFGLEDSSLRLPDEVSSIESQSSELMISSSDSNFLDSFFTDFGRGHWSSLFEGSLFLVDWHNSTGGSFLMS
jgi:hypothetical protein